MLSSRLFKQISQKLKTSHISKPAHNHSPHADYRQLMCETLHQNVIPNSKLIFSSLNSLTQDINWLLRTNLN